MREASKWLPLGLGGVAFALYALIAPSGFFWLDSAELSAASLGLGSPHPTGFPLYMMLGKLAGFLPIGELAFRINLLSGLCAAFAVGGVGRLVLRLGEEDAVAIAGAVAAGGLLMVGLVFARQATVAEVYAPTAALLVASLLLFDEVARGGGAAAGLSLAWIAGLGFGAHSSFRLLLGLPILALFVRRLHGGARWPLLAPALTALAALALQLYLPVRSNTGRIDALDWGHPRDLGATLTHATGEGIHKAFADEMMSGKSEVVSEHFGTFGGQLVDQFGVIGLLAMVAGLALLMRDRRSRWLGAAVIAGLVLDLVYSVWLNPMGLVDLQNGVPTAIFVAIAVGACVAGASRAAGRAGAFVAAVAAAVVIVPAGVLGIDAVTRVAELPRRVSEAALADLEPSAVLFTQSDNLAAGTLYLTQVEGMRPDVAALVIPMLVDRERAKRLVLATSYTTRPFGEDWQNPVATIARSDRPLYWERGQFPEPAPIAQVGALVSRVNPEQHIPVSEQLADAMAQLATLYRHEGLRDRSARRQIAASLTHLGRLAYASGALDKAETLFLGAIEIRPEQHTAWTNLGVVYGIEGKLNEAAEASERALYYQPNRRVALVNAARYRMLAGDLDVAAGHAEHALKVAGEHADSWNIAGLVELRRGNIPRARERLEKAIELNPRHREARAALNAIAAEHPNQ